MNRKLNLSFSLAAGLLGGLLSHYISPKQVYAQTQAAPPKELRAQSFVLVNEQGIPAGVIGFDKDGSASIELLDKAGKIIWSAGEPKAKPASTAR